MFPSLNSADSALAVLFDNPRTINPEVSLSRRFTANRNGGFSVPRRRHNQTREPTVYLFIPKLVLENLHECVPEIPPRCVDRLQGHVQHGLDRQGTTHDAPRLVYDDEFPFSIVMDYFHGFSDDWGFVSVYDIPRPGVQPYETFELKTPYSMRSPFRIMVSGLAISPLMVVTPESMAYLWTGTRTFVSVPWTKIWGLT